MADHATDCAVVRSRKMLTASVRRACEARDVHRNPNIPTSPLDDGSEEQLNHWFDVLKGIVAEYTNGGDEEVGQCTCDVYASRKSLDWR